MSDKKNTRQHWPAFLVTTMAVALAFAGGWLLVRFGGSQFPAWAPVLVAALLAAVFARAGVRRQRATSLSLGTDLLDAGTGALNEQGLVAVILSLMSIANRYQRPLSVATLQPDGNPAASGRIVDGSLQSLRTTDRIGCHRNGELLVVMPETELEQARAVIRRLCQELGDDRPVRAFGVAAFHVGDDLQQLLGRSLADMAPITEA